VTLVVVALGGGWGPYGVQMSDSQQLGNSRYCLLMSSGGIYLRQGDELVRMMEQPYEKEDILQALLEDYPDLLARDKASLDIFWLRDESLEDTDNLPAPKIIAAEIVEDLQAALDQFSEIAETLSASN
jgi:hypothetical protein